eukprot:997940-Pelagomonas_calceolata.AAC.3
MALGALIKTSMIGQTPPCRQPCKARHLPASPARRKENKIRVHEKRKKKDCAKELRLDSLISKLARAPLTRSAGKQKRKKLCR